MLIVLNAIAIYSGLCGAQSPKVRRSLASERAAMKGAETRRKTNECCCSRRESFVGMQATQAGAQNENDAYREERRFGIVAQCQQKGPRSRARPRLGMRRKRSTAHPAKQQNVAINRSG